MSKKPKRRIPVDPMVRRLVGQCHVGESNRSVIKHLISRLAEGRKTWRAMPKRTRKKLMKQAIQVHAENRDLYRCVMTGSF